MKKTIAKVITAVSLIASASVGTAPAQAQEAPVHNVTSATCVTSVNYPGCATINENFDGNTVPSMFTPKTTGAANGDRGHWGANNVRMNNGTMEIVAKQADQTSGEVTTRGNFSLKKGYVEFRSKQNTLFGWMGGWAYIDTDGGGLNKQLIWGEADMGETMGDGTGTTQMQIFTRDANDKRKINANSKPKVVANQWYTYGLQFDDAGVTIYRDGVKMGFLSRNDPNFARSFPDGVGMNIIFSAKYGAIWHSPINIPEGVLSIDYFRYFPEVVGVKGGIGAKYNADGGANTYGSPKANEFSTVNGGYAQNFTKNYTIYWHPETGAHSVYYSGAIGAKYRSNGYENGYGYPTTDENRTSTGAWQEFYNPATKARTLILWDGRTGATTAMRIGTAITEKWRANGSEWGYGYAQYDEQAGSFQGAPMAYQKFSRANSDILVLWTPKYGAHALNERGAFNKIWADGGRENGKYGFPVTDEYQWNGGTYQRFSNGYEMEWRNGSVKINRF